MPDITLVTADSCRGPGDRQLTLAAWEDMGVWARVTLNITCKKEGEKYDLLNAERASWV